jgi:rfaE bifunctional protein nucleotidyltransferase chain/domain
MGRVVEDTAELAKLLGRHRAAGQRVVMANGGFDLLHVGHIRYLRGAAAEGDVLVVAVNSDRSVRANKGPGRPLMPLAERMEIISAIEGVTYVTTFDEATCDGLLETLRPDVHAKGTDYTPQNLPERDTLRRLGIQMAIVGDPKGHASTTILNRMRQEAPGG